MIYPETLYELSRPLCSIVNSPEFLGVGLWLEEVLARTASYDVTDAPMRRFSISGLGLGLQVFRVLGFCS